MKIRLNKAHFPVTTLGLGQRIGLWVQGCHIQCPGCLSRDTWEPDPAREVELELVLAWCRYVAPEGCDGVTISGGEPFEQPVALAALLDGLTTWRHEIARSFDILCYSGFPLRHLERQYPNILIRLDAIIPEPYVDSLPRGKVWRGSANQPLVPLSPLGRKRYAALLAAEPDGKGKLQVSVDAEGVWYIGIPDRGDMDRLEAAAYRRGVVLGGVSWRA
jgi:anaerobic ribonucleoside-triphosphate reductase activating protein